MEKENKQELTPERVIHILKKNGIHVNLEEAKIILDFVNKIAGIAFNQYLRGYI